MDRHTIDRILEGDMTLQQIVDLLDDSEIEKLRLFAILMVEAEAAGKKTATISWE